MLKLGITGFPLTYTKSPGLHRGFLRRAKLPGSYDVLPFDPTRGKREFFRFLDGLRAQGYRGLNVTIPLKEWAFEYASKRGGVASGFHGKCAQSVGAANTLVFMRNRVSAANTDAHGVWADVSKWLPKLQAANVVLVGTGGAARGIVAGIINAHPGARCIRGVEVWGRDQKKAKALERLAQRRVEDRMIPSVVFWCLPPLSKAAALTVWRDVTARNSLAPIFLYDLNYGMRAQPTASLAPRGRRREGLGMLRDQAIASFILWQPSARQKLP